MPGTAQIICTSRGRSRRKSGSPPVSRILSMPSGAATRTKRVISSNVSSAPLSRKAISSGMHYVQGRLRRSVTLMRRLLWMRPNESVSGLRSSAMHNNLRISVTDRCNLRCTYCMPEEVVFRDRSELLTFEEITHFVRVAAGLGVDKVRLTGGEPLVRKDLHKLVRMVAGVPGIKDVGLTTNGILLADQARPLFDAGLRRLNVSLDTLDPGRFRELTRRDGLEKVLVGLDAAKRAGFDPVKVNAVAIRGFTDRDAVPLARFCREHGFELRFIEYMPIGAEAWEREKVFFAHEILEILERDVVPLRPTDHDPNAPALEFEYADGRGRVGIIASVSRPFCASCN